MLREPWWPSSATTGESAVAPERAQPVRWCTKHQRQSSPASADCMTGWVVSRKCAVACRRGEESQQATWPQLEADAAGAPRSCRRDALLAHAGRVLLDLDGGASLEVVAGRAGRRTPASPLELRARSSLGGDVEHRLLDVEHRQHLADHLAGDLARSRTSSTRPARRRSSPAGSGRRARSASPGRRRVPSRSQAAKLRWSMRCRISAHAVRVVVLRARRAPCSPALDACWSSVARARASSAGSGRRHLAAGGPPRAATAPG